ncbi:MAG: molybdopterin oxidoreductase [Actinomycetales bacterium]|nr:molybdopterin oxidoreductase [Actinomycetales bacterium]
MAHRGVEQDPAHHRISWWVVAACVSIVVLAVGGLIGGLGL